MSGIALALILSGAVIVRGAIKGLSPVDAFRDVFDRSRGGEGLVSNPANTPVTTVTTPGENSPGGSGPATVPRGGGSGSSAGEFEVGNDSPFTPAVERWRGLVRAHFPERYVDQALSVMACESEGNPNATNPTSGAAGLFQHLPKYWSDRSFRAGIPGANIYDPESNVAVAGWLFGQSHTWKHWSCQPSVF